MLFRQLQLFTVIQLLLLTWANQVGAVTLIEDANGQVIGATGIDAAGGTYNVEFTDGSCPSLFDGCDALTDFPVTDFAALETIHEGVLSELVTQSVLPENIAGCSDISLCEWWTPYDLAPPNSVAIAATSYTGAGGASTSQQFEIISSSSSVSTQIAYMFVTPVGPTVFSADGIVKSTSGGFMFPDGTVQKTAEIAVPQGPAASAFAVDASDVELGLVMGVDENCCLVVILTERSYFLRVSLTDGQMGANGLFYTNLTCSGTPYTFQAAGTVIKNESALYYVDRASLPIASLAAQSFRSADGACNETSGTLQGVWQASPNDPLITGVSSSDFPFQLPIRFERR